MSETIPTVPGEPPRCDRCGLEITTGAMAALCPNAMECEFWPHSDGSASGDGAELLIARMWIANACDQIGMQIEDRKRLAEELRDMAAKELPRLMSEISEECWAAGWMSGTEWRLWKAIADENDDGKWGMGRITLEQTGRLAHLSQLVGGWCDGESIVPMAEWLQRVREFPR